MFSVVLLVSGPEAHVGMAVRSVWAQRVDDLEIIMIEDAASEHVRDEIDQLVRQSPMPMRIVRTAGVGQPRAWNAGAQAAGGRYLAFLDADDEYHADRLDVFRRAHSTCSSFIWGFSGVEAIDARDRPVAIETIRDGTLRGAIYASTRPVEAIRNLPHMFTPVSCGNLIVDAGIFRELGGFRDYPHLSDWDLALRLFRTSDPVTIELPLYRYRIRPDGGPGGEDPTVRSRLVNQERTAIVEEYRSGVALDGFADNLWAPPPVAGSTSPLDPDVRVAIAATLWGVDQLRRIPLLYRTVRRMARLARRTQGRPR